VNHGPLASRVQTGYAHYVLGFDCTAALQGASQTLLSRSLQTYAASYSSEL